MLHRLRSQHLQNLFGHIIYKERSYTNVFWPLTSNSLSGNNVQGTCMTHRDAYLFPELAFNTSIDDRRIIYFIKFGIIKHVGFKDATSLCIRARRGEDLHWNRCLPRHGEVLAAEVLTAEGTSSVMRYHD
jgi:hypothetical protein